MRLRRAVAAVLGIGLLAGCGGGGKSDKTGPSAQEAAAAVAGALSKGSAQGLRIRKGNPEEELPVLVKGMHGLLPEVTVAHVSPSTQSATVKLAYRWPLSTPWTYETEAVLVRKDESSEWELNWSPAVLHPRLTDSTRLERQRGDASERGNITGRDNAVLVQSTAMQMLGLNKVGLDGPAAEASARQIAELLRIDPEAYAAKVRAAGAESFVDAVPVRREEVPATLSAIKGAGSRTVTLPAPRTSGFARALIGTMGFATEEQAAAAGGGVAPGDLVGISGLQRTYDRDLRGGTGNKVYLVGRNTEPGSDIDEGTLLADFPDTPGTSLATTIDDDIQTAAEAAVKDVKVPASVVVLKTGNGAVLAAADSPAARRRDDSTTAGFGPGMAASPIAALALMRSGVDLKDRVPCPEDVVVEGRKFDNGKSYRGGSGEMTIAAAMADECVTAVAGTHARLDGAKLPEAAKSLGLDVEYDLGTATSFGSFPAPEDAVAKAEALTGEGGRGKVQSSALGLATMAASVQAKRTVVPFLVPGREPPPKPAAPLSDAEAKALQDLMKAGAGAYSPLTAVSTGRADGRVWAVGYSDAYAVAVVMSSDKATVTPAQVVRSVAIPVKTGKTPAARR